MLVCLYWLDPLPESDLIEAVHILEPGISNDELKNTIARMLEIKWLYQPGKTIFPTHAAIGQKKAARRGVGDAQKLLDAFPD